MVKCDREHKCSELEDACAGFVWKKLKKTKQRISVYEVIHRASEPMSAADIYQEIIRREGECRYAISTVYRAIQAFDEEGFLCKTKLPDSDTTLYEWDHGGHTHYAICLGCHKRIAITDCPFHKMHLHLELPKGFEVTGHRIEIYGYCDECRERKEHGNI